MMNIRDLQARLAKLTGDARAVLDKAGAENRDMTAEEQTLYDGLKASIERTRTQIDENHALAEAERAATAVATVNGNGSTPPRVDMGVDRKTLDAKGGFQAKGEFFAALIRAGASKGQAVDKRLVPDAAAPTTYGNEGAGADGGFLVPPEFSREIFTLTLGDDALMSLCDNTPVQGNSMVFPKDETTPWGTDGIRAYWQAEATAGTQTKPIGDTSTMRLHKLMGLTPLTDELVADSQAGASFVTGLIARSIRWKTNEAILNGTGAGQPRGCFSSAAAIVVNKDGSQAASTVSALNISNMRFRLPPGSFRSAVWLITPDALPLIVTLTLGNYPIFMPIGGLRDDVGEGMIMGRPIFPSQHVAALSSQGDISLVDLSYYRTITKAGAGVETATSLHLYFDADAVAFRSTFRIDGQPKLAAAISQNKSTNKLSPFIQLQAR
jgi:HK97 family phage major capsid protein